MKTYTIDPSQSRIEFTVRHLGFSRVNGFFKTFGGTIQFDGDDVHSLTAHARVAVSSIDTGDTERDDHLRSNAFFCSQEHPDLAFVSTGVTDVSGDRFTLDGKLTVRGVTRSLGVKARIRRSGRGNANPSSIAFSGSAVLNRKDFGLEWNAAIEAGGLLVSENVTVTLEIEARETD